MESEKICLHKQQEDTNKYLSVPQKPWNSELLWAVTQVKQKRSQAKETNLKCLNDYYKTYSQIKRVIDNQFNFIKKKIDSVEVQNDKLEQVYLEKYTELLRSNSEETQDVLANLRFKSFAHTGCPINPKAMSYSLGQIRIKDSTTHVNNITEVTGSQDSKFLKTWFIRKGTEEVKLPGWVSRDIDKAIKEGCQQKPLLNLSGKVVYFVDIKNGLITTFDKQGNLENTYQVLYYIN